MIVQARRMREILQRLRGKKATIVVGGPYCTVAESQFAGLCDVLFIGEAEETWPEFLTALARGEPVLKRYEQKEKTNMETVPTPRYDLIKADYYIMASIQFSRGCPFLCEFCDIITIFGRRPRLKTNAQMIAEFEAVRAQGFRRCFLVDDNFIGNKAKAKELLREMIVWQKANGYPLKFVTEASINLADDPELMQLMVEANILQVFIGVESPRKTSLSEIHKVQNVRGDSQLDKLRRVRDAGIVVAAGFIVGFDSDDENIFDEQFDFITEAGIAVAPISPLAPIPSTPLYDRLKAEGRLDFTHPELAFHPKNMTREALMDGYMNLMKRLYAPEAFFDRLFRGHMSPGFRKVRAEQDQRAKRSTRLSRLKNNVGYTIVAGKIAKALYRAGLLGSLGKAYLKIWFEKNRPLGRDAISFASFVDLCLAHWHFYNLAHGPRRGTFGAVLPEGTVLFDRAQAEAEAA